MRQLIMWRAKIFLPLFTAFTFAILLLLLFMNRAQEQNLTSVVANSRAKWLASLEKENEEPDDGEEVFKVCHTGWDETAVREAERVKLKLSIEMIEKMV